jgi:hypothetical protein
LAAQVFGAQRGDPILQRFGYRGRDGQLRSAMRLQPLDADSELVGKLGCDRIGWNHCQSPVLFKRSGDSLVWSVIPVLYSE